MPGPTHRIEIVPRTGSRVSRFSHPPIDRGGNAQLLAGGEIIDAFDWERAYRLVGTVRVDPVSHIVDIDNRREIMRIERVVSLRMPGQWLVYASWTGRLDVVATTSTVCLGGVPVCYAGEEVTLTSLNA